MGTGALRAIERGMADGHCEAGALIFRSLQPGWQSKYEPCHGMVRPEKGIGGIKVTGYKGSSLTGFRGQKSQLNLRV